MTKYFHNYLKLVVLASAMTISVSAAAVWNLADLKPENACQALKDHNAYWAEKGIDPLKGDLIKSVTVGLACKTKIGPAEFIKSFGSIGGKFLSLIGIKDPAPAPAVNEEVVDGVPQTLNACLNRIEQLKGQLGQSKAELNWAAMIDKKKAQINYAECLGIIKDAEIMIIFHKK